MKIVIVGGGASGLTAAISAAEQGAQVTVLECADRPARKICATGNGKCNLTNKNMDVSHYRSADPALVKNTLARFGCRETLEFFENQGMLFKDRNGYVYPSTGQASSVAELLLGRCRELGVVLKCNTKVLSVRKKKEKFTLFCETEIKQNKKVLECRQTKEEADRVILAAGSTAGGFGCDSTGTELAASLGHKIIPEVPALTSLKCANPPFFREVSGVRVDGHVALFEEGGDMLGEDTGELQLTGYGISGIPVFQVSRYAAYALREGKEVTAVLDFLPEYSFTELWEKVQESRTRYKDRKIAEVFSYLYNGKLVRGILTVMGIKENQKISEVAPEHLKKVIRQFKQFKIKVTAVSELQNSQVCAGGVSTGELTGDFMSRKVENLYIIGEMTDVDGICGGYNLQYAWASGRIAGLAAGRQE